VEKNNFVNENGKTIGFKDKNITIFEFDKSFTNGCNYNSSVEDHKEIANQLILLFKTLIHE